MKSSIEVPVPLWVRLRFGRAAVQTVADEIGADILHIKGEAADESLRPETSGSDVDILVRPAHVAHLDRALQERGWSVYSTFLYGSPFGHAQTYLHRDWGYLDLHRWFPGITADAESAFEWMWTRRTQATFAGVGCAVPELSAQATLLILNSARGESSDLALSWTDATIEHRTAIQSWVERLGADVAFAAATGDLERYRRARDYRLWKVVSQGGSRSEEWWARVRSAPTLAEALRTAARAPLVNVEHITIELGRPPTRWEFVKALLARPVQVFIEAASWAWSRIAPRSRP